MPELPVHRYIPFIAIYRAGLRCGECEVSRCEVQSCRMPLGLGRMPVPMHRIHCMGALAARCVAGLHQACMHLLHMADGQATANQVVKSVSDAFQLHLECSL